MSDSRPALSVIAPTIDNYETLRLVLDHVRGQSILFEIELVIVCPDAARLDAPADAAVGYWGYQVVENAFVTRGHAAAAGVRAAQADVVVMVEDHAYPRENWATELLKRHQEGFAAVGPTIENANPLHTVSWADLLTGYGRLIAPQASGPAVLLAGHNCSYDRTVLLRDFADDLPLLLNVEVVLHERMRERGLKLCLVDEARIAHTNFERLSSWMRAQFHHGRIHAATRSTRWTFFQRLRMALGSPTVPLVRTWRTLRLPASRFAPHRESLAVALLAGNTASAVGELLGTVLGEGGSARALLPMEFHRERHFLPGPDPLSSFRKPASPVVAPDAVN